MEFKWPEIEIESLASGKKNAIAMGPFGSRIKTDNFVELGVPVIKGQNLTNGWLNENEFSYLTEEKAEELNSSSAVKGDIVITHRGTLGQIGYIHENTKFNKYIVSQSQMKLSVDRKKILPLYLFYFFKSRIGQHRLLLNTSQTGVPAISRPVSTLKKIKVPVPPLNEQRKITKMLKDIDLKINLNDSIISNLEQLAQTLFKRWFVDFEFPNENGEPYKSSGGEMVESELGMMPEGWEIKELQEVSNGPIVCGKTPSTKKKENYGEHMPFITIPDMHGQVFALKTSRYLSEKGIATQPKKTIPTSSICVSCIATPGLVVLTSEPSQTNQQINSVIPMENDVYYLFLTLKDKSDYIRELGSGGSTTLNLNKTQFSKIKIIYPTEKLRNMFHEKTKAVFELILKLQKENESLQQLRDTLLPKLLSGEIELPDEIEVTDDVPIP